MKQHRYLYDLQSAFKFRCAFLVTSLHNQRSNWPIGRWKPKDVSGVSLNLFRWQDGPCAQASVLFNSSGVGENVLYRSINVQHLRCCKKSSDFDFDFDFAFACWTPKSEAMWVGSSR